MKLPAPRFISIRLSTLIFAIFLFFIVWIDLPDGYPIKFAAGPIYVDRVVQGPKIDVELFGRRFQKTFETKLGLDLKGGSHLLFEADMSGIPEADREQAINSARDIIERRVNFFGVSEPQVQTIKSKDTYRISVDLPGVENVEQAIGLIGTTAKLEFMEEGPIELDLADLQGEDDKQATVTADMLAGLSRLNKETGLTGKHVKRAFVEFSQTGNGSSGDASNLGSPSVGLEFDKEGGKIFEEVTERNIGKQVGIFIDGQLISAPTVSGRITGQAVITGAFTLEEAQSLADAINSGALPVPVKLLEQRNIGPTLGQEAIQKSVFAGVIGLLAVIIFMLVYYGRFGLIAGIGLLIYGLISYAIIRTVPVVLTLPGIAGFILSIGMAVDANILIFERIKEERRKGRDHKTAVNVGFGHAIDAIKDANIATLLVAFILFNPFNWDFFPLFGLIKGFALTLAIGVGTSLFTGVVITKRLMKAFKA